MQYDLKDKIIIITGGNSGIGKAASIQLAKFGATVVLACRSKERGAQAVEEVRNAANSTKVELIRVDMSSQNSIRQFVIAFNGRFEHLDVLIHNAANFDLTQKKSSFTPEGLETILPPITWGRF